MDDPALRHQQLQAELGQIGIALPGSLTSRTTRCQHAEQAKQFNLLDGPER